MIWTVHAKPDAIGHHVVAVPETSAKWAFVFGTLWLLWNRLWWAALVFLLVGLILNAAGQAALLGIGAETPWWVPLATLGLALLPRLWLALEGHELRRRKLERRGWLFADTVEAPRRSDAELIALARLEDRREAAVAVAERERIRAAELRAARLSPRAHRPRPPLPQTPEPATETEREREEPPSDQPNLRLVETIVARPTQP